MLGRDAPGLRRGIPLARPVLLSNTSSPQQNQPAIARSDQGHVPAADGQPVDLTPLNLATRHPTARSSPLLPSLHIQSPYSFPPGCSNPFVTPFTFFSEHYLLMLSLANKNPNSLQRAGVMACARVAEWRSPEPRACAAQTPSNGPVPVRFVRRPFQLRHFTQSPDCYLTVGRGTESGSG